MPDLTDISTSATQEVIQVNYDIHTLMNKAEGTITEDEFLAILKRYSLRQGLIAIGQVSSALFSSKSENKISQGGYRDPVTGAFVTQFSLAYLANALLVSGANDYKYKKLITQRKNFIALNNIYSNGLVIPETYRDHNIPLTEDEFLSSIIRMHTEQLEAQFLPALLVSRSIVIFTEVINEVLPSKSEELSVIFERETGLNIKEYFFLVMAVFACAKKTATFRKENLTEAAIPSLRAVLTDQKVTSFIKMLSADYWTFRRLDEEMNSTFSENITKNRFNPLQVYPIIKTDLYETDQYVVPNIIFSLRKGFEGIYWWFHKYFEDRNEHREFRKYFGEVFELYAGRILNNIYGTDKVKAGITYTKNKSSAQFFDWWVKTWWKVYLFEIKSYQFPLATKQSGEIELLKKEIRTKVVGSIRQVYERIADIPHHSELSIFRRKKLIPIIVFMNIPLVSSSIYKNIILEELNSLEQQGFKGITKMKVYLCNINELELYQSVSKKIPLEKVFKKYENNPREGFHSVVARVAKGILRNEYLDNIFKDFWTEMSGGVIPTETEDDDDSALNIISGAL
jgi:hypothetical protein